MPDTAKREAIKAAAFVMAFVLLLGLAALVLGFPG
jgi:hypothetical protein